MTTVAEVLDRATQIIAKPESWHQGSARNDNRTAFCSLGAIQEAVSPNWEVERRMNRLLFDRSWKVLAEIMVENYPELHLGDYPVPLWNDDPNRQHHEVIAMFEKAAAKAAEAGI